MEKEVQFAIPYWCLPLAQWRETSKSKRAITVFANHRFALVVDDVVLVVIDGRVVLGLATVVIV